MPRKLAAVALFALILGIIIYGSLSTEELPPQPRAGYLIAAPNSAALRVDGTRLAINGAMALNDRSTLRLPAGFRAILLKADGTHDVLQDSGQMKVEAPAKTLNYLALPVTELATEVGLDPDHNFGPVRITSPVGVTRFTNPVVTWVAAPDTLYDVALRDTADLQAPVRIARGVRPPVPLDEFTTTQGPVLRRNVIYEIYVREAGGETLLGQAQALVAKDAARTELSDNPVALLLEVVDALNEQPVRSGDAYLAFQALPAAWHRNELAQRLRLKLAAELGLVAEHAAALQFLNPPPVAQP